MWTVGAMFSGVPMADFPGSVKRQMPIRIQKVFLMLYNFLIQRMGSSWATRRTVILKITSPVMEEITGDELLQKEFLLRKKMNMVTHMLLISIATPFGH